MKVHLLNHFSELDENVFDKNESIFIIADSGGTKTDWCISSHSKSYFFTSQSFHYSQLNNPDSIEFIQFLKLKFNSFPIFFYFFGAGYASELAKEKMRAFLRPLITKTMLIESDVLGAAIACYGNKKGHIAIMGTGSVIALVDHKKISNLSGGFGYLIGDEGSGYYFGKLLLKKYLLNQLSPKLMCFLNEKFKPISITLEKIHLDPKKILSELSKELVNETEFKVEFDLIHKQNITAFFDLYLPKDATLKKISVIGSYGFFNQSIVKTCLENLAWELNAIIEKPIKQLSFEIVNESKKKIISPI